MGGHHYADASGERVAAIVTDEFDVVISLHRRDGHGTPGHVEQHYADLPEGPLTAGQLETVCRLAETAGDALRQGRRVLVRCHSGYNRSVNNHMFVDYLTTGLDVARLLTGLDSIPQDGDPG